MVPEDRVGMVAMMFATPLYVSAAHFVDKALAEDSHEKANEVTPTHEVPPILQKIAACESTGKTVS
jgi:hypothetical protein